jgi:hypothetical protein
VGVVSGVNVPSMASDPGVWVSRVLVGICLATSDRVGAQAAAGTGYPPAGLRAGVFPASPVFAIIPMAR